MLSLYRYITAKSEPHLLKLLKNREEKGKEDTARLHERRGRPSAQRPHGKLTWIHAASVGEAQSALILIRALSIRAPDTHILLTTGTTGSAEFIAPRLPSNAFHQFIPLDHPAWVAQFLNHWKPDFVLWMESELWPNLLEGIKGRDIPAILVNGRLSKRSFGRWKLFKKSAQKVLSAFSLIIAQTEQESGYFKALGHDNVTSCGNIKYSAEPLPADTNDLELLSGLLQDRTLWLYASSHQGEELLAARIHAALKPSYPNLLTIIVPRHPNRRDDIAEQLSPLNLDMTFRGASKTLPSAGDDLYIADTFGELGLFYRLAPMAVIGRSFSDDGGGGHNPIEAAQLNCAVLYGPNVQYQKQLFAAMESRNAALQAPTKDALLGLVRDLLARPERIAEQQKAGLDFAREGADVIHGVMKQLEPLIEKAELS